MNLYVSKEFKEDSTPDAYKLNKLVIETDESYIICDPFVSERKGIRLSKHQEIKEAIKRLYKPINADEFIERLFSLKKEIKVSEPELQYCPFCEQSAARIIKSGYTFDKGSDVVWAEMECENCKVHWTDV